MDGLITRDRKDLLHRADAARDAFGGGFQIYAPESALAFVDRLRARYGTRQNRLAMRGLWPDMVRAPVTRQVRGRLSA